MGNEATCRAELGEKRGQGKALLETDDVLFRGDFRAKLPLKSISGVRVEGPWLVLESGPDTLRLELGAKAAAWAEKIKAPKGLLDKLGVRAGSKVACAGAFEEAFMKDLASRGCDLRDDVASRDLVFLRADTARALSRLTTLRKKVRDDAAVWVVFPKGQPDPKEGDVILRGREAGFKDVKVARFSETHTALKFVVPKEARKR